MFLANRMNLLKPSVTLSISAKAKALKASGVNVIDLSIGEPDFPTPDHIKYAGIDAIKNNKTLYTPSDGSIDVKRAVIHKFERDNGIKFELNEVSIAPGAKYAIFSAFMATLNRGDEVIIPSPCWVSYVDMVTFFDGTSIVKQTKLKNSFKLTPQELEESINENTKWLILNSPSNPTGTVYSKEELRDIGYILLKHPHVYVMTDDIYEYITYDNVKFNSIVSIIPELKSRTLIINGGSKAYCMTGWRIGYAAGPAALIKAMAMIYSQSISNPSSISQEAVKAGLVHDDMKFLNEMKNSFKRRRDFVIQKLSAVDGIDPFVPHGAFYIFSSIGGLLGKKSKNGEVINSCMDFAQYMLDVARVAIVPGLAFSYPNYFRLSFAISDNALLDATTRIADAVNLLS